MLVRLIYIIIPIHTAIHDTFSSLLASYVDINYTEQIYVKLDLQYCFTELFDDVRTSGVIAEGLFVVSTVPK